MTLHETETIILLMTIVPMGTAAMFVILTYYRLGYGKIGIFKTAGYSILAMATFSNVVNHIVWENDWLDVFFRGWSLVGWIVLAVAAVVMWLEADRSIP